MFKDELIVTDRGFVALGGKETATILFDDVVKVVAYKIDQITIDCVCCDITIRGGDWSVWSINEDLPGFDAVMARLEDLPGFYRE